MTNWNCSYRRTYSGHCEQPRTKNSERCYYHEKVDEGLIEVDEQAAIHEMPLIATL